MVQLEKSERTKVDTVNPAVAVYTGNIAVADVSVVFIRLRSYAVSARNIVWRDREVYCSDKFLWFSSFQNAEITIMTNKRNMFLEKSLLFF